MKRKVTNKQLKESFQNIIYMDNLHFLSYAITDGATFYNSGVYGKNYDVYIYDYKTILVTGYRNIPYNKRNYEIEQKYNALYDEAIKELPFGDDKKYTIASEIMQKYVEEMTKND